MKNLKQTLTIAILLISIFPPFGGIKGGCQNVGINEPNPDNSALLEMTSTERGLLVPRMTEAERDAIVNPAEGLIIYNYNDTCLNIYTYNTWYNMCCCDASTTPAFTCGISTVDDIDGNTYNTVLIGSQCWLKENMRTTKYPDGSAITKGPAAHGAAGWNIDNAYYSCPPNTTNNGEDCTAPSLGLLYQWSAAMNGATSCNGTGSAQSECTTPVQGICPDGWHIPSHYEWVQLEQQICNDNGGGSCNTDFPYDETTSGWLGTNGEGSDMANHIADQNWTAGTLTGNANFTQSGLDLGPSGFRSTDGNYNLRGNNVYWWSSTENGITVWDRNVNYTMTNVNRNFNNKAFGFSVRCIKD